MQASVLSSDQEFQQKESRENIHPDTEFIILSGT